MVGFRNIANHEYQAIDANMLNPILTKNLEDLEQFNTILLTRFHRTKKRP
jgi:uncharacterized protein YutE (UPF0331/DUF86 family)